MYKDKPKYNGKNNSFLFKLTIFCDICAKIDVFQEILFKVFPTMLISLALDHYYLNTNNSTAAIFDKMYELI